MTSMTMCGVEFFLPSLRAFLAKPATTKAAIKMTVVMMPTIRSIVPVALTTSAVNCPVVSAWTTAWVLAKETMPTMIRTIVASMAMMLKILPIVYRTALPVFIKNLLKL